MVCWGEQSCDRSRPGLGSHWAQWDAGTGSSGRIRAPWGPAELRISPAVGGDADARLALGGLPPQLSPAAGKQDLRAASIPFRNASETWGWATLPLPEGEDWDNPSFQLSRLYPSLGVPGTSRLHPTGPRELPGASRDWWLVHVRPWRRGLGSQANRQAGAGRPPSCFALPQRPRKEVVAFLGEEKGSRTASAGQPAAPTAQLRGCRSCRLPRVHELALLALPALPSKVRSRGGSSASPTRSSGLSHGGGLWPSPLEGRQGTPGRGCFGVRGGRRRRLAACWFCCRCVWGSFICLFFQLWQQVWVFILLPEARQHLWGVGKGPPAGVPWGLVQAELPASCLPLLPGASTASDFTQRKEEEGGSCPPSALGQGCVVVPHPRTKLALGVPHTNIGDWGWVSPTRLVGGRRGDTLQAPWGAEGLPRVGAGGSVVQEDHATHGGPGGPHRVPALVGANPPPAASSGSAKPKIQLLWHAAFSLGPGGAPSARLLPRFGYLLQGCFRTARGWPGEITELHRVPIPPCLAFWKCPFSSLESIPVEQGDSHDPSDALPGWEKGCWALRGSPHGFPPLQAGAQLSPRGVSRELVINRRLGKWNVNRCRERSELERPSSPRFLLQRLGDGFFVSPAWWPERQRFCTLPWVTLC